MKKKNRSRRDGRVVDVEASSLAKDPALILALRAGGGDGSERAFEFHATFESPGIERD